MDKVSYQLIQILKCFKLHGHKDCGELCSQKPICDGLLKIVKWARENPND